MKGRIQRNFSPLPMHSLLIDPVLEIEVYEVLRILCGVVA